MSLDTQAMPETLARSLQPSAVGLSRLDPNVVLRA